MGDDEFAVPHGSHLPLLCVLQQGPRSAHDGEPQAVQSEAHPHILQPCADPLLHVDILRGRCRLIYLHASAGCESPSLSMCEHYACGGCYVMFGFLVLARQPPAAFCCPRWVSTEWSVR